MIQNEIAERDFIGYLIIDPERAMRCDLQACEFAVPEFREIYTEAQKLYATDMITLPALCGVLPKLKEILIAAAQACVNTSQTEHCASLIHGEYIRQRAYVKAIELTAALDEARPLSECQEIAGALQESLSVTAKDDGVSADKGILEFFMRRQKPKEYISTGMARLDKQTYIDHGSYVIVGGRPSAGKTALTLQMAQIMAKERKVVYFSLETSAGGIYDRLVARYTHTPLSQVKTKIEDWTRVAVATDSFSKLKLTVVNASGYTVQQIKARALQEKAEVIFIDYLSLIQAQGKSLYERVTNISIDLHTMAQRTGIAVIALSQLNRAGNGEPDMTSLRESGQIEQDADIILLIQGGEDKQKYDIEPRKLIIAKNKEGMTGAIPLRFSGPLQTFWEEERNELSR